MTIPKRKRHGCSGNSLLLGHVADSLAAEGWAAIADSWKSYRSERVFYREKVLRPFLMEFVQSRRILSDTAWLDLGCGDGEESAYLFRVLRSVGANDLRFLGLDRSREQLALAVKVFREFPGARVAAADLRDESFSEVVRDYFRQRLDLATSFYVVHDYEGAELTMRWLQELMAAQGTLLLVVVNPFWVESLVDLGDARVIGRLKSEGAGEARWFGELDMIQWDGRRFPVPHFHRTIYDYSRMLQAAGFQIEEERYLFPAGTLNRSCTSLTRKGRLLATAWPASEQVPTSVAFVCKPRR